MRIYIHYALWATLSTILIGAFFGNIIGALGIFGVMSVVILSYFLVRVFFPDQIQHTPLGILELEENEALVLEKCRVVHNLLPSTVTLDDICYYSTIRSCYSQEEWDLLMAQA